MHNDSVNTTINDFSLSGCIHEVSEERAFIDDPLTLLVNASCRKKLVLDLWYANQSIEKKNQKIKFEGVRERYNMQSNTYT